MHVPLSVHPFQTPVLLCLWLNWWVQMIEWVFFYSWPRAVEHGRISWLCMPPSLSSEPTGPKVFFVLNVIILIHPCSDWYPIPRKSCALISLALILCCFNLFLLHWFACAPIRTCHLHPSSHFTFVLLNLSSNTGSHTPLVFSQNVLLCCS
jgi:hypothetical protein